MNGNIKCFNGGHIALGLLAILALGLCVAIIPLSFTYIMGWLRVKIAAGILVHTYQPSPFSAASMGFEAFLSTTCISIQKAVQVVGMCGAHQETPPSSLHHFFPSE